MHAAQKKMSSMIDSVLTAHARETHHDDNRCVDSRSGLDGRLTPQYSAATAQHVTKYINRKHFAWKGNPYGPQSAQSTNNPV